MREKKTNQDNPTANVVPVTAAETMNPQGREEAEDQNLKHDDNNSNKNVMYKQDHVKSKNAKEWELHELYEHCVQSPPSDVDFLQTVYEHYYHCSPKCIREDFCGTAALSVEWVKRSVDNYAIGIDLDLETLQWGYQHHVQTKLSQKEKERIWLIHGNVLDGCSAIQSDIIVAQNFSWMLLRQRQQLIQYFQTCQQQLRPRGLLLLDIYGGPESQQPCHEMTYYPKYKFAYHWIQETYNPVTNHVQCGIGFSFPHNNKQNDNDDDTNKDQQEPTKSVIANLPVKETPTGKGTRTSTLTTSTTTTNTTKEDTKVTNHHDKDKKDSSSTDDKTPLEHQQRRQYAKDADDGDDENKEVVEEKDTKNGNNGNNQQIHKAFAYDFRLYSIAEIVDILQDDVQFQHVQVYWEKAQEEDHHGPSATNRHDGCKKGDYYPLSTANYTGTYIAYIVAYNS